MSKTAFYNEIANRIAIEVGKCTPQLYAVRNHTNNRLPPYADSSSVLLTVNERFFLLTSGHSVHGIDLHHLGIMIDNDFCTICGDLQYFEPNSDQGYEPGKLDIAIFELGLITVSAIKEKYTFLSWDKLDTGYASSQISPYIIFGYAASETKKHFPSKEILPSPFILRTISVPGEYYNEQQIDPAKTLVLQVDQKQVMLARANSIRELPELGGISGCGVWRVLNLTDEIPQYKLASIITGENETKSVLYSTKIDRAVTLLKTNFNLHTV